MKKMQQEWFDTQVERRGTSSLKWERYGSRDVIPLWVADMDFPAPPAVIQALQERVAHGIFGYTTVPQELIDAVMEDVATKFRWKIQREWIVWIPGLVSGLCIATRSVGTPQSDNYVFTPVYPPFLSAPVQADRKLVEIPLQQNAESGCWDIDFSTLESRAADGGHLLLCNPHNPVGRVFRPSELQQLADLCVRKNLILTSDEIHNGLVLHPDCQHTCIASLHPAIAERTITLMAPSKTYNIPGLGCSLAIIPNATLRKRFRTTMHDIVPSVNLLGLVAAEAAYRGSEEWRLALLDYLNINWRLIQKTLGRHPQLRLTPLEATYLAWIDCRSLHLDDPVRFFEKAGVGLSDGKDFGLPGFVRLNFGCPRALLQTALERMETALAGRES